jgi:MFS superfamily sulfate permease-like transporter
LEFEDVHFMWKIRAWKDLFLMALTFFVTIFWSVEAGILISITLSLILVVKHSTYPKIAILGRVVEGAGEEGSGNYKVKYKPLEEIFATPGNHILPEDKDILLVKVEESLFFANTGQMKDRLRRAEVYEGLLHVHPSEEERRPVGRRDSVTDSISRAGRRRNDLQVQNQIASEDAGDGSHSANVSVIGSEYYQTAITLEERPTVEMMAEQRQDEQHRAHDNQAPSQLRAVVFDIENMPQIDASAVQILTEIVEDYHRRSIEVCFVKLRDANKPMFLRSGLLGEILGSDHYFRKISDAMQFLQEKWQRQQDIVNVQQPVPQQSSYSTYSVL